MIRGSNTGGRSVLLPHLAHGLNINWDEATGYWKAVIEALDSDEMPSMLRAVVGG